MKSVGSCAKLKRLNISGDSLIGDDAIHNLILGNIFHIFEFLKLLRRKRIRRCDD